MTIFKQAYKKYQHFLSDFSVRLLELKDSKRVWEIRNQPLVRNNSNDPQKISWVKHQRWFKRKYFTPEKNFCFVLVEKNDKVIGYCRFDHQCELDSYLISIAVDSEYHGRGLGHLLLNQSLRLLKPFISKPILAEIKKENLPSIKVFEKNNFILFKEDDKNCYLKHTP